MPLVNYFQDASAQMVYNGIQKGILSCLSSLVVIPLEKSNIRQEWWIAMVFIRTMCW